MGFLADSYKKDLKNYPDRLILGSETFCADAFRFYELAKENPRLIGDFVWAGTDYLGEVMVGSWEYSDYADRFDAGPGWISSGSGRINLTGKPLGEALYTRVALEREKSPYIAVRPICHEGRHSPSAWKMTNAIESWSFRGYEGRKATVEVYARASSVCLTLNGRSLGRKKMKDNCVFTFKVPYENGTLTAIAFDDAGREIGQRSLKTAGEETVLLAEPEERSVQPGHLAFIRVRYADKEGIVKPTERGLLTVQADGGTLEAFGSACPFCTHSYKEPVSDTYYGEALAIVRADKPGTIRLRVTDGKLSAEACVTVDAE